MKRKLLKAALILFWLPVLLVMAEAGDRVYWNRTWAGNRYVRMSKGLPWRSSSQTLNDVPSAPALSEPQCPVLPSGLVAPSAPDAFNGPTPLPPDIPARVAQFLSMSPEERRLFDVALGTSGYAVERDGATVKTSYVPHDFQNGGSSSPKSLLDEYGPKAPEIVREVYDAGQIVSGDFELKRGNASVIAFPERDAQGAIACAYFFTQPRPDLPPDSMWDVVFTRYRCNNWSPDHLMYINNRGFRSGDVVIPKPAGVYRIACIGESTTMEGHANEDTYPSKLEARLRECFDPAAHLEVVNCGIPGMYTRDERARLLDYLALEPDMLICYMGVNDIYQCILPAQVRQRSSAQRLAARSWVASRYASSLLMPGRDVFESEASRGAFTEWKTFIDYAKRRGVKIAVCSIARPDGMNVKPDERAYYEYMSSSFNDKWCSARIPLKTYCGAVDAYNAMLRDMCKREGLIYVPTAEAIQGGMAYFSDLCHMTDAGISWKSLVIFEHIKDAIAADLGKPASK